MSVNRKRRSVLIAVAALIFHMVVVAIFITGVKLPELPLARLARNHSATCMLFWGLFVVKSLVARKSEGASGALASAGEVPMKLGRIKRIWRLLRPRVMRLGNALGRNFQAFVELLIGLLTAWIGYTTLQASLQMGAPAVYPKGLLETCLPMMALFLCGFIFVRYLLLTMANRNDSFYASAVKGMGVSVAVLAATVAGVALEFAGYFALHLFLSGVVAVFVVSLGLEILLFLLFDLTHSRRTETFGTRALNSRIVGLLFREKGVRASLVETLHYQFGFDVTGSWFVRILLRSLPPLAGVAFLAALSLTSIVVIEESEQGVQLRFGFAIPGVLQPGLHFKAPWPVDKVETYDVKRVRRIHVGSHKPASPGGDIYDKRDAILWSGMHGLKTESLLIVAPPKESDGAASAELSTVPDADSVRRAPGVSLMGGDVYVEYVIENLEEYVRAAEDTELLLTELAEKETSDLLVEHDIDSLIGYERTSLGVALKERLNQTSARERLGVKILFAGFNGFHPPVQVAESFHATGVAQQMGEAMVETSRAIEARLRIEATGSQEMASGLLSHIPADESLADVGAEGRSLFLGAGGAISVSLAKAVGYRTAQESAEASRAQRFLGSAAIHDVVPQFHSRALYFGALEQRLKNARKYVVIGKAKDLVVRFEEK